MQIAFNASPITRELMEYPLELVDYFIINEVEGRALAGVDSEEYDRILEGLAEQFPHAAIVLTVGEKGVLYCNHGKRLSHGIYAVKAVDTTAAGDTFCGYFLAGLTKGLPMEDILKYASMASAIAVSRRGASTSIPTWEEVVHFEKARTKEEL